MRILHILDHSIPLHSGYAFRTLSILKEQEKRGWETSHITSTKHYGATEPEEMVDGFHFYRTLSNSGFLDRIPIANQFEVVSSLTKRLEQILLKEKPDLLHAHSPCLNGLAALNIKRKHNIPVVYEMRASWEDAAVNHGSTTEGSIRYRVSRALETYVLKRVDAITTICEGLREDICLRGIPKSKVTVIPNAVDIDKFNPTSTLDKILEQKLGIAGKHVLGFLGSFYDYEGIDLLIESLPAVLLNYPDARILLIGGGPQENNLKQLAKRLGVSGKVLFLGRVPHDEVERYYSLINILVYARKSIRLTELVTPLKPLEAMAGKKMFVASDIGGHRELIENGVTGTLFKAGDSEELAKVICKLFDEPDSWNVILEAGRRFVEEERNWSKSVSYYQNVYESLLDPV